MAHPVPSLGNIPNRTPIELSVDKEKIEAQLNSLASLDIAGHAGVYDQMLSQLQEALNASGRGGQ